MSGITSIVVGILMFFIFGVGYIVGKCVAYDEKIIKEQEEYYANP